MSASVVCQTVLQSLKRIYARFDHRQTFVILQTSSKLHARSLSSLRLGDYLYSRENLTLRACIISVQSDLARWLSQSQRFTSVSGGALGGSTPTIPVTIRCWKCGADSQPSNFCKNCGIIQPVWKDANYFEVFGLPVDFNIDVRELTERFRQLQWNLHPDKFTQKSKVEQALSADQSSLVNKSYQALLKPMSRGLYLLELHGASLEEGEIHLDPIFLMEIMETNEQLAETNNIETVRQIGGKNHKTLLELMSAAAEAFAVGDIQKAKDTLARLKYFANIDDKVQDYESKFAERT